MAEPDSDSRAAKSETHVEITHENALDMEMKNCALNVNTSRRLFWIHLSTGDSAVAGSGRRDLALINHARILG